MIELVKMDIFPYELKNIECLSWFECFYLDLVKDKNTNKYFIRTWCDEIEKDNNKILRELIYEIKPLQIKLLLEEKISLKNIIDANSIELYLCDNYKDYYKVNPLDLIKMDYMPEEDSFLDIIGFKQFSLIINVLKKIKEDNIEISDEYLKTKMKSKINTIYDFYTKVKIECLRHILKNNLLINDLTKYINLINNKNKLYELIDYDKLDFFSDNIEIHCYCNFEEIKNDVRLVKIYNDNKIISITFFPEDIACTIFEKELGFSQRYYNSKLGDEDFKKLIQEYIKS